MVVSSESILGHLKDAEGGEDTSDQSRPVDFSVVMDIFYSGSCGSNAPK